MVPTEIADTKEIAVSLLRIYRCSPVLPVQVSIKLQYPSCYDTTSLP